MRLTVKAASVVVFVIKLKRIVRLRVILRFTLLESQLENIVIFGCSDSLLGWFLWRLHYYFLLPVFGLLALIQSC